MNEPPYLDPIDCTVHGPDQPANHLSQGSVMCRKCFAEILTKYLAEHPQCATFPKDPFANKPVYFISWGTGEPEPKEI